MFQNLRNLLKYYVYYEIFFFKKWANPGLFLFFRSFLVKISIQIEKSIDGVLGIRTWGHRMVGADDTTELWRPPYYEIFLSCGNEHWVIIGYVGMYYI